MATVNLQMLAAAAGQEAGSKTGKICSFTMHVTPDR